MGRHRELPQLIWISTHKTPEATPLPFPDNDTAFVQSLSCPSPFCLPGCVILSTGSSPGCITFPGNSWQSLGNSVMCQCVERAVRMLHNAGKGREERGGGSMLWTGGYLNLLGCSWDANKIRTEGTVTGLW